MRRKIRGGYWGEDLSFGERLKISVEIVMLRSGPLSRKMESVVLTQLMPLGTQAFPDDLQAEAHQLLHAHEDFIRTGPQGKYVNWGSISPSRKQAWKKALLRVYREWLIEHGRYLNNLGG